MHIVKTLKEYKKAYAVDMRYERPSGGVKKLLGFVHFFFSHKVAKRNTNIDYQDEFTEQFDYICKNAKIRLVKGFAYPFDRTIHRSMPNGIQAIVSVTPDYKEILSTSLQQKKESIIQSNGDGSFKNHLINICNSIEFLIDRYCSFLYKSSDPHFHRIANHLERIKHSHADSLEEALQRILFFNGLFWQMGHKHNGLGRLDLILRDILQIEKKTSRTYQDTVDLLQNFINVLAQDSKGKSSSLIGDTGQTIFVGGIDQNGLNVDNEITHALMSIFETNPIPDPKLLLRVNENTSPQVWTDFTNCVMKGSGSPLLVNEKKIIPLMVSFGYDQNDVYNFGTSACWEPLIIGKSFDQNNSIKNIVLLDAIFPALKKWSSGNFETFVESVEKEIENLIKGFNLSISFDCSPLFSLFFDECITRGLDFSRGGAKYNFHGLLAVGLPNLINSLLNIKKFVFNQKICSIEDCILCIESNYKDREDLRILFLQGAEKFGVNNTEIITLTNQIMKVVGDAVELRTIDSHKLKIGFSSPAYIDLAEGYPASLDGRRKGEPFAVHLSPQSSNVDVSEILNFASKLEYSGNRINGNVVDFIIPTSFIKEKEKFTTLIKNSCNQGLFELQLNVLDKETLIDAKKHPEKYPNLIVRVWGFSAYFNDLPESYKDNLIERACRYQIN